MVLDKIAALVAEQFRQEREDITEDTVFEELEADEMDIADLILAVEDTFRIDIDTDAANALTTVGDLADVVEEALGLR